MGATASRTFGVVVTAVNDPPTLDAIGDQTITVNSPEQTVNLTGITAGGGESQALIVTSSSSNTSLIPNPTVTYTSADTTGSIAFTPSTNQTGDTTITVNVEDAGFDGSLASGSDNANFSQTFIVSVIPLSNQDYAGFGVEILTFAGASNNPNIAGFGAEVLTFSGSSNDPQVGAFGVEYIVFGNPVP